jgi:hypothetical protein
MWTVWEHDRFGEVERVEKARFVRDGFSWLAFLFSPLWLLANGMIVVLVAYLAVSAAAAVAVDRTLGTEMAVVVSVALALWLGFEARALRRWSLARRGWTMTAVVEGKRFETAERRYVSARLAERSAARPTPPGSATPPPLPPGAGGPRPSSPQPWGAPASPVIGVFPEGTR